MSRHPSPGPSHSATHNTQHTPSAPSARRSRPTHSIGIAAGAEDVKYHSKYKDLKRKVKEIEGENDKLHFKILQAKRSLQRMKLERAILYERLATASPSADPHDRHPLNQAPSAPPLPPHQQSSRSYSGSHQARDVRDRPIPMDAEPPPVEYLRQHSNSRPPGSDPNRPVPPMEPPPLGSSLVPSPHMSSVQSPRHNTAAHDASRHLPPLPHLPPVGQYDSAGRSHSLPQPGSPPIHHAHTNSTSSHDRGRSQSSRPPAQNYPGISGQQYPDPLPPVQRVLHSPPPHSDRDRPPPRRVEGNEYPPSHNEPHLQHSRHPSQPSPHLHSSDTRTTSTRIHSHQRLGPGTYINREDPIPRQYDLDREKGRDSRGDWERDPRGRESGGRDPNMHSPYTTHRRPPPPSEYPDHSHTHQSQGSASRPRDGHVYYHEGNPYPSVNTSRSDSGSGSGIGVEGPSRPDSRTQFYEQQDRSRPSYRLRPVSQSNNNEDVEFVGRDDVRSQSRDAPPSSATATIGGNSTPTGTGGNGAVQNSGGGGNNYPSAPPPPGSGHRDSHPTASDRAHSPTRIETSRKRSRNEMEMEVDSEKDAAGGGDGRETGSRHNTPAPGFSGSAGGGGGMLQAEDSRDRDRDRDRGSSKRYQRELHHRNVDNREASVPPPPAATAGGTQDQQDNRMSAS